MSTDFTDDFTNNLYLFATPHNNRIFQISDGDSLWMWSRDTLIPGLYSTKWYNEKKIQEGWLKNNEDYLVGVPRVRLLRVQQSMYIY